MIRQIAIRMHALVLLRVPFRKLLHMIRILISVTCQPPAGYVYHASVDKYYKPVREKVVWHTARDACISDESILVELRTIEEYRAVRPIYGNMMQIVNLLNL